MNALIPLWIIGGPFVGLLILSFSFKGPSAMGGAGTRISPRTGTIAEASAPLSDPAAPSGPRRNL